MTKTELERAVADAAGVEKRTAASVLDALEQVVTSNVRKGDPVTIRPGFIKVSRKDVKARKERKGTNPFTGEPTVFKARPASKTAKGTAGGTRPRGRGGAGAPGAPAGVVGTRRGGRGSTSRCRGDLRGSGSRRGRSSRSRTRVRCRGRPKRSDRRRRCGRTCAVTVC